jgi:TDG/mug DNA glycosylase family protein
VGGNPRAVGALLIDSVRTRPTTAALVDVDDPDLPLALAAIYHKTDVGDVVRLRFRDECARWWRRDATIGAGFAPGRNGAVRQRSLPDIVGPGMRLLMCGLNPSLYAADAGIPFARAGNRFWRAAIAAGITDVPRDPLHALHTSGVGFTDLVKRATVSAAEIDRAEYEAGLARVERLCARLELPVVCMCGLDGWRSVIDRRASPGWQPRTIGGARAYVMPSTSGLNARTPLEELANHLRIAAGLAGTPLTS